MKSSRESTEPRLLHEQIADLEQLLDLHERVVAEQSDKRKQMIARLRQSEANFRLLVERLSDAVLVERDGVLLYANPALVKLLGYADAIELTGHEGTSALVHPNDQANLVEHGKKVRTTGELEPLTLRWVRRDGAILLVEALRTDLAYDGAPAELTIARDITERVSAAKVKSAMEAALRESEARYRALFDNGPTPKLVFDAESLRILAANAAASQLYGCSLEELHGLRLPDLKVSPDPELVSGMQRVTSEDASGTWHGARQHRRKNGQTIDVEIAAQPLRLDGRHVVLASMTDVTERRRLEEQLRQAQKMEAIGRLAGGVAHDFNNLLTVILGCATLVMEDLGPESPQHADIEEIRRAAGRAAELTHQLLAFGRRQMLEPTIFDPSELLGRMERMLRRIVGEGIELSVSLGHATGKIHADPGQIEQVVMNLVLNARDASPHGGEISIETSNVALDEPAAVSGVPAGRYVMLSVTDHGAGMDAATKAQIFEPFFTTKDRGRGTGLGLATVFGIVKQSNGHIEVESEPGRGTTVKVFLPRSESTQSGASASPPPRSTHRRGQTVLVVEDEDQVRRTIRTILRREGYQVLEAQNGGEAFLVCETHPGPIHLLVTDLVMPRMNGDEVARRLSAMRPDMKILFVSGYSEHALIKDGVVEPGVAFLHKPFTPELLAQKTTEVLDGICRPTHAATP